MTRADIRALTERLGVLLARDTGPAGAHFALLVWDGTDYTRCSFSTSALEDAARIFRDMGAGQVEQRNLTIQAVKVRE